MSPRAELSCERCGATYRPPVVAADTPRKAFERRVRQERWPICRPCWEAWDINSCPDGREHLLAVSEEPWTECVRCGVGGLWKRQAEVER